MCMYESVFLREAEARYGEAGSAGLSDTELVQMALGLDKEEAEGVADAVISRAPALLPDRISAKVESLLELCRRIKGTGRIISSPDDAFRCISHFAMDAKQEMLIVMELNGANEVMDTFVATQGLIDEILARPREVFAKPIADRAVAIIIAHNHPSGITRPSEDDKNVTARMVEAGKMLGIKVLDHLVFTEDRYYSFLSNGLIKKEEKNDG